MAGGRPTSYRPEYCDVVIECGKQGKSLVQMANACDCVKATLFDWADSNPEFSIALEKAKQYSQEWWEQTGQEYMVDDGDGRKINAGLWSRSMAARFPDDYREKSEIKHSGNLSITSILSEIDGRSRGLPSSEEESV